jgi:prephenate dehydrogenase
MDLNNATIGIIGGTGRMGTWLAGLFERRNYRVLKISRNSALALDETVPRCQVMVVSVPMKATLDVISKIAPLIPQDGLLMDLTSLKHAPLKAMLQSFNGEIVGLHPLFGPKSVPSDRPLTVAVCPGRGITGLEWIEGILIAEGYVVKHIDPVEHDRIMGIIQGTNHFAILAFALFLSRCGVPLEELEAFSTPSFRIILDRIKALMSQPSDLFQALITENPESIRFIDHFRSSVNDLFNEMDTPNKCDFNALFLRLDKALNSTTGRIQ